MGPKWANVGANMTKFAARSFFLRERTFALFSGVGGGNSEKQERHDDNAEKHWENDHFMMVMKASGLVVKMGVMHMFALLVQVRFMFLCDQIGYQTSVFFVAPREDMHSFVMKVGIVQSCLFLQREICVLVEQTQTHKDTPPSPPSLPPHTHTPTHTPNTPLHNPHNHNTKTNTPLALQMTINRTVSSFWSISDLCSCVPKMNFKQAYSLLSTKFLFLLGSPRLIKRHKRHHLTESPHPTAFSAQTYDPWEKPESRKHIL